MYKNLLTLFVLFNVLITPSLFAEDSCPNLLRDEVTQKFYEKGNLLFEAFLEKLKNEGRLPEDLKKFEKVKVLEGALLVRHLNVLKLMRPKDALGKETEEVSLEGSEYTANYKIGSYQIIETRTATSRNKYDHYLNIIFPDFSTHTFESQNLGKDKRILKFIELPNKKGKVIQFGDNLGMIARPSGKSLEMKRVAEANQGYVFVEFDEFEFLGDIVDINFDYYDAHKKTLMGVKTKLEGVLRNSLVDFSLAFVEDEPMIVTPVVSWDQKEEMKFVPLDYDQNSFVAVVSGKKEASFYQYTTQGRSGGKVSKRNLENLELNLETLILKESFPNFSLFEVEIKGSKKKVFLVNEGKEKNKAKEMISEGDLPLVVRDSTLYSVDSKNGTVILEVDYKNAKKMTNVGYLYDKNYNYIVLDGKSRSFGNKGFILRSTKPLTEFKPKNLLFKGSTNLSSATFSDGRNSSTILIDRKTKNSIIIPGLKIVKEVKVGARKYFLVLGQMVEKRRFNTYLAIYDVQSGTFLENTSSDSMPASFHYSNFNPKLSFYSMGGITIRFPQKLGYEGKVEDLEIKFDKELRSAVVSGKLEEKEFSRVDYYIALSIGGPTVAFYDSELVPITGKTKDFKAKTFKSKLKSPLETSIDFVSGEYTGENSFLSVLKYFSSSQKWNHIQIPGELESASLKYKNGYFIDGISVYEQLTQKYPVDFRWIIGEPKFEYELYNRKPTPLWKDKEISLFVSDSIHNEHPRVYLYTKFKDRYEEIVLSFSFKENAGEIDLKERYMRELMGMDPSKSVDSKVNRANVTSIKREGGVLFIETSAEKGVSSRTYFYNLRTKKLMFMIPNYEQHVDIENYRFYIGNSTYFNSTNVVVADKTKNRMITYFDFGEVKLATKQEGFVKRDEKNKFIKFQTETGLTRVFDEKKNSFLGLLPNQVKKIVEKLEQSSGSVMNRELFQAVHEPLFGYEDFMNSFQRNFSLSSRNRKTKNLLIVGESGSAKSHALREYVVRYLSGDLKPRPDIKAVFFRLNAAAIHSGTSYRGEYAKKFTAIADAAKSLRNLGFRLVLVFDDLHTVHGTKRNFGEGDIFSNLNNLMSEGILDVIATVTPDGEQIIAKTQAKTLSSFTKTIRIPSVDVERVVEMIEDYMNFLKLQYGYEESYEIMSEKLIQSLVDKISTLNINKVLPGSAFEVVKQTISEKSGSLKKGKKLAVTAADIDKVIASKTGIPKKLLERDLFVLRKTKAQMMKYLKTRVRGQDDAVETVVNSVFSFAIETNRPDWPILRLFSAGPTGVGKTELARALSDFLFGNDKPFFKISGEDFMTGSMGVRQLKQNLVKHIREYPFNIILIDEMEKMSQEARNIVLSLADGKITDIFGSKVRTSFTILMATSNIGVMEYLAYANSIGFGSQDREIKPDEVYNVFLKAIKREMKPEQINRWDEIVVFNHLKRDIAVLIIDDYLNGTQKLAAEPLSLRFKKLGYDIKFEDSLSRYILDNFVDPEMGARRLTINIEKHIVKKFISVRILDGYIKKGKKYEIFYNDQGEKIELKERSK